MCYPEWSASLPTAPAPAATPTTPQVKPLAQRVSEDGKIVYYSMGGESINADDIGRYTIVDSTLEEVKKTRAFELVCERVEVWEADIKLNDGFIKVDISESNFVRRSKDPESSHVVTLAKDATVEDLIEKLKATRILKILSSAVKKKDGVRLKSKTGCKKNEYKGPLAAHSSKLFFHAQIYCSNSKPLTATVTPLNGSWKAEVMNLAGDTFCSVSIPDSEDQPACALKAKLLQKVREDQLGWEFQKVLMSERVDCTEADLDCVLKAATEPETLVFHFMTGHGSRENWGLEIADKTTEQRLAVTSLQDPEVEFSRTFAPDSLLGSHFACDLKVKGGPLCSVAFASKEVAKVAEKVYVDTYVRPMHEDVWLCASDMATERRLDVATDPPMGSRGPWSLDQVTQRLVGQGRTRVQASSYFKETMERKDEGLPLRDGMTFRFGEVRTDKLPREFSSLQFKIEGKKVIVMQLPKEGDPQEIGIFHNDFVIGRDPKKVIGEGMEDDFCKLDKAPPCFPRLAAAIRFREDDSSWYLEVHPKAGKNEQRKKSFWLHMNLNTEYLVRKSENEEAGIAFWVPNEERRCDVAEDQKMLDSHPHTWQEAKDTLMNQHGFTETAAKAYWDTDMIPDGHRHDDPKAGGKEMGDTKFRTWEEVKWKLIDDMEFSECQAKEYWNTKMVDASAGFRIVFDS